MPKRFGPSVGDLADSETNGGLNRHGRRRLKWRSRRDGGSQAQAVAPVLFESYEPRLLLSGAPIGTVLASSGGTAVYQDDDGTTVTATLTGPGAWQFVQGALLPELNVTGTDATSVFSIATSGGDGRTALEGVSLAGPLASFAIGTTDPTAFINLGGAVQTIVLGNVRDTVLTASAAIGSIAVESWQSGGGGSRIEAPSIGSLTSNAGLNLDLDITGLGLPPLGQALGSVLAKGSLLGGTWQVAGGVGSIDARSVGSAWTGSFAGEVGVVQTSGDFAGALAAPSLQVLAVGRGLLGAHIEIGATLGADGRPGGTGANADSFGAGYLGQLRVGGSLLAARVHVGVDPVNGVYDDGDDLMIGGPASRIQTIIIGGRVDSASRIVAGALPATLHVGGRDLPAAASRRFATDTGDSVRPVLTLALANDTGPSATDRITADPAMAGTATDAGGVLALTAGLDGASAMEFVDLMVRRAADGSFTLSKADLDVLAGGSLSEGPHVLHVVAVDASGNARTTDIAFTLSNTQITAALANDTGISASDGHTKDYAVAGKVQSGAGLASLVAAVDGGAAGAVTVAGDGAFTLSKAAIDTLAGSKLAEGGHSLLLTATDKTGIVTRRTIGFIYDVTAPGVSGFTLTQSSDTGTLGDNITAATRVGLVGVTEAGATATLGTATALAGGNGGFQFADVVLADGANKLSVTVADLAGNSATTAITITRSGTVSTDAALTWNQATLEAVRQASVYPEIATRLMAMVSIAQFDTLAAIEGSAAYLVQHASPGPTDTGLALAYAAHRVLTGVFDAQKATFDAILLTAENAVADGAAKTNARTLGQAVGQAVLDIRAADGSANYLEYLASDAVGKWRPTAPTYQVAEQPQWAELTPFAMDSPDQFQAPPPPDLTSGEYATDVNETKALGAATGSTRTTDQSQQAQFWADGRGSYTPPGHWNQIAQQVAVAQGNSLAANVRLFAQLNVALADTAIAAWNTKFAYNLWRPIDAIRNADIDGNAGTTQDSAWAPLLITPPHPEYVSGHSSFSAAAATVLKSVFGDQPFSTTSYTLAGVTRDFTSFDQAVDEAGRSRIFGGIHYEFSNQAGQALGASVAGKVLERFNLATDTQGPNVIASIVPVASNANQTIKGQVLDNLSGVAAASYSIDGGAAQALALDADGRFEVATKFTLDGVRDGLHSITFAAADAAGNSAKTVTRIFRLDTLLPLITLSSIAQDDTISSATRLSGTANPTGTTLRSLSYSFDGGRAITVSFDQNTGSFDTAIATGALDIGAHELVITASDNAGNAATLTRNVTVATLTPFVITSISPASGATDVGSTVRPEVRFSRAVKLDSLNANSFYAAGADGEKIAATIVPAQDGTFAWLFFDQPMPGGATITIHVNGALIRAAADGAFLDGDGDGVAGGELTFSFTTVSLTNVAGTILKGRVVDPGPDLEPMTFDDIGRGPDGVIHTTDDVFKLPIVHAKVYILGQEDRVVFTDTNGEFTLTDLPAGTIKVAIDGRTATNPPTGVFFPEMVMDVGLRPGVINTVMDSMGTAEERAANAGRAEVYLPRVPDTILSFVDNNAPTTVGVDAAAAPNLTEAQRNALTLTVDPGSVVGADGAPLTNAQVGISTVPPELVRDMLPPGVLQHTFDITIQAPGVSNFTTPARITFPNVFNAAPGSKLNILSFDHTTGMLVINGTGTVSEDGLTVVSDEGSGVRAPGWHGVTPPGGCGDGGSPPPPPPPPPQAKSTYHESVNTRPLIISEIDSFALYWQAAAKLPDTPPPPPSDPNCPAPPLPEDPPGKKQPNKTVTVTVSGPLAEFMKPAGDSDVAIGGDSFTLAAGSGANRKFTLNTKTFADLGGMNAIEENRLYGSKIVETVVTTNADGSTHTEKTTHFLYRYIDATDDKHTDGTMTFAQTLNDGSNQTTGKVVRRNELKISAAGAEPIFKVTDETNFGMNAAHTEVRFDPTETKDALTSSITIKNPLDGKSPGEIKLEGKGVEKQGYLIDKTSMMSLFDAMTKDDGTNFPGLTKTDKALFDTQAERDAIYTSIQAQTTAIFKDGGLTDGIYEGGDTGKNALTIKFLQGDNPADPANDGYDLGGAIGSLGSPDVKLAELLQLYKDAGKFSATERSFRAAGMLNNTLTGSIEFYLDNFFEAQAGMDTAPEIKYAFGMNDAHEIGHHLGLFHTGTSGSGKFLAGAQTDIMRQGLYLADTQKFTLTAPAAQIALHIGYTTQDVDSALAYYDLYWYARTHVKNYANEAFDSTPVGPDLLFFTEPTLDVSAADGTLIAGSYDLGTVAVDGAGGATATAQFTVKNMGLGTLKIAKIALTDSGGDIKVDTSALGVTLDSSNSAPISITFDPQATGAFSRILTLTADNGDSFSVTLKGLGIAAGPSLLYENIANNFGGVTVNGGIASVPGFARLTNVGAADLTISSIALVQGQSEFTLSGFTPGVSFVLKSGESMALDGAYDASALGLQAGILRIVSDDPARKTFDASVIGTGLADYVTYDWGRDYIGLQVQDPFNPPPLHVHSDDDGNFKFFLPSAKQYRISVFDPQTGLIATDAGITAPSGAGTNLTAGLHFRASIAPDGDFDGLPDDIEFAIGTNPRGNDTDRDGLSDFTEIAQGMDPLGGLNLPTGVVAAAALKGTAEAVTVTGNTENPTKLTAYLATGSQGLALVDVSRFTQPTVLAELDLAGENTRVAVDQARATALVAGGSAGLHFVDVANPAAPTLLRSETFGAPVTAVALRDGTVFAAAGTSLYMLDVSSGDLRQSLGLGGATITDVVVANDGIYTLDSAHRLVVLTISGDLVEQRGSIVLSDSGERFTVGNGVAYVSSRAAGGAGRGGYLTVDIINPDSPALLSGVDDDSLAGTALALNGSGLGVAVGGIGFVFGGFKGLDVVSVADPANTGAFNSRYALPDFGRDVTIANGVAFVADGSAGLQIVNYRQFDTDGLAPTASISVAALDEDPGTPGVQVLAGRSVHVIPTVGDDVQVRNVELLVNGAVVANDPSFPFDLFASAPPVGAEGGTMTIQLRATDTGGNATLSDAVTLNVVPDSFPPDLVSINLAEGAKRFFVRAIDVRFDEPINPALLSASKITLVRVGADGIPGTADDVPVDVKIDTRAQNQVVTIAPLATLLAGDYHFRIDPTAIADSSGNALAAPILRNFTIRPASDVKAAQGTPEAAQAPSANPGQQIGIAVPFDPATARMTFATIDTNGTTGTVEVTASGTDTAQGRAYFVVPYNAMTGDVSVYSVVNDVKTTFPDGDFPLQVVPVITNARYYYLNGDAVVVTLSGLGIIEGNNTQYTFGSEVVVDTSAGAGPDAITTGPDYYPNSGANVQVPLSDTAFGPITIKTAGGTSAPFTINLTGVVGTALSGTPADASIASANAGQAVTLTGTGLSTATDVMLRYRESGGGASVLWLRVTPVSASADGTQATIVVPNQANDVFGVHVIGASAAPTLQVVPTLSSFNQSNNGNINVYGSGFVEADMTFTFANAEVKDTAGNTGPDIYSNGPDNTVAYLAEPAHGLGTLTVTTAGGTSAPRAVNELLGAVGYLRDIAVDPANGDVWVVNDGDPALVSKLDLATGTASVSHPINAADYGTARFYGGLQVVPSAFTLGSTSVPTGSLLLISGWAGNDRVVAMNPATGATIATLVLPKDYNTTHGLYDPGTGHLFIVDRSVGPNRIVELDPTTGTEVSSFSSPVGNGEGGFALDPSGNSIWYASYDTTTAWQLSKTGTQLRAVALWAQGLDDNELTGIAFDASGKLLASTTAGRIYVIDPDADFAQTRPTVASVVGGAVQGTAAQPATASANVGQMIEIVGTNFGPETQVLFPSRDNAGNTGVVAATPLIVSPDGTRLQVLVPDLATTGDIRLSNTNRRNFGYWSSYADGLYRGTKLSFTADDTTTVLSFADGGIEGVDNESWGIDNVRVTQGASTIFEDNFEGVTANAAWSNATIDTGIAGITTAFSGRFASQEQRLTLTGLTAGQTYTLSFDLYAFDSWDGNSTSAGPDIFQVQADGTTLMRDSIAAYPSVPQTINNSAGMRLQIVPTLTGIDGRPGAEQSFTLNGSGFMDGASTITIGGVALVDSYGNTTPLDVYGNRNSQYSVVAPFTVEGKIRVITEGGYAEVTVPSNASQQSLAFSGITATAASGTPTNLGAASANVGQLITLTGRGFNYNTQVQFEAVDDTGKVGTLTRQVENYSNGGTSLTVQVPAMARSGQVRVLGATGAQSLQIVPTLRSLGGTVGAGNTVVIEGTGLVQPEVVVQVDGRAIGNFALRTTADASGLTYYYYNNSAESNQQLLTVVLPNGVTNPAITVSTVGGTANLRTGVLLDTATLTLDTDVGDTLATAGTVALGTGQRRILQSSIGDNAFKAGDVDIYSLNLAQGDSITTLVNSTGSNYLRIFDAKGQSLATQYFSQGTNPNNFTPTAAGLYYFAVSSSSNASYDPTKENSGYSFGSSGTYSMTLDRIGAGQSRLSAIQAAAEHGTAALASVAAANTGQTITLQGHGLQPNESAYFTVVDYVGHFSGLAVAPLTRADDGNSVTVRVPDNAVTGMVRLQNDRAGVLLQIVPTLTDARVSSNGEPYNDGYLVLTGSGFTEGNSTIGFGKATLTDHGRQDGIDVDSAPGVQNGQIVAIVPNGVPTGPLTVTTVGGTSEVLLRSFALVPVTAQSGTPANAAQASANTGQSIELSGIGLSLSTGVVFETTNAGGTRSQLVVNPWFANATGTQVKVTVPAGAVTGKLRMVGDQTATEVLLQIVPTLTGLDVFDNPNNGNTLRLTLSGSGFVEGRNAEYRFGTVTVFDGNAVTGPDVYGVGYPDYRENAAVNLYLPMSSDAAGAITVKTEGGTSAPLTNSFTGLTATALSGTPANAAKASANPGQAVTLSGAKLTTATDVLFTWIDSAGTPQRSFVNPASASPDGTAATLLVPASANGVATLHILGSTTTHQLQIVPTLSSFNQANNGYLYVYGSGFVEGASTFAFPAGQVKDTSTSAATNPGVDIYSNGPDNTVAYLAEPAHGLGTLTVTTAGGTSAPRAVNELLGAVGYLRDIAVDPANGDVWVVNDGDPALVSKLDLATGTASVSHPINAADYGTARFYGGLQVVPSAFTLGSTSVPTGSLLLISGWAGNDRVVAMNPATGATIATLVLPKDYNTTHGLYDPVTGHLFIVDRSVGPNRIVELDPANGAEVSSFACPAGNSEGGFALDPSGNSIWYASYDTTTAWQLSKTGTQLRAIPLWTQNLDDNELTGIAFDATGKLLASTTAGRIYVIDIDADAATSAPTLTAIIGTAAQGTAAQPAAASANVGQVIELLGTNFGPGTQVIFGIRDNAGNTGTAAALPRLINADGTRLQVVVPDLATTADVRVSNLAVRDLGFSGYTDAIYRQRTLSFTADDTTTALRFADGGLESGVDNESWGIDNVKITKGATTVFSDNFETSPSAQWSNPRVEGSIGSPYTRFSGRFANNEQKLTLTGLTAGQSYTLTFDLYALDSLDGNAHSDFFQVSADGVLLMRETLSNYNAGVAQTINNSAGIRLQVVPTLAAISGSLGSEGTVTLNGSGFMEGASTVTIGGVASVDTFRDGTPIDIYGNRNDNLALPTTLMLDGKIRVTTEGGFAELAGPARATQPASFFSAIQVPGLLSGTPATSGTAANAGQTITLVGQGFTDATLVQFTAVDDTGQVGTVTRTGDANVAGTALTIKLPALARSGAVTVLGAAGSQQLQVVPRLRGWGGTMTAGSTILIDATGLVGPELSVQIDGHAATVTGLRTISDTSAGYYTGAESGTQQILAVTVPAGVLAGLITASTAGGTAALRHVDHVALADLTLAADVGETLATSQPLVIGQQESLVVNAKIADGDYVGKDVDLYGITLASDDTLRLSVTSSGYAYTYLRVFDASGVEKAKRYYSYSGGDPVEFHPGVAGTYYVGISGYSNQTYDPLVANSGTDGYESGNYALSVLRTGDGDTSLTGITTAAAMGTPAEDDVASANPGQSITIQGVGLLANDQIVFTVQYGSSYATTATATPTAVAADGTSLTVVVPDAAITGTVRLQREGAGLMLQVVPVLIGVSTYVNQSIYDSSLSLTGRGFVDGASLISFGPQDLVDISHSGGASVGSGTVAGKYVQNAYMSVTMPDGAPLGPLSITTVGGTSNLFDRSFSGLAATVAGSGTPANAGQASANPGQTITLLGTNLTADTGIVFETIDSGSTRSFLVVNPASVAADGTSATVVVPDTATTGKLRVFGDANAADVPLQIVPVINSLEITSVSGDGNTANLRLKGSGFAEGSWSRYSFGTTQLDDAGPVSGADVYGGYPDYRANGTADITVPLSDASFGPIIVQTAGGTSAPYTRSLASITATATSGTPANTAQASANPGQEVTLNGTGLTDQTQLLFRWRESGSGAVRMSLLTPKAGSAATDGTSAIFVVPANANGAFAMQLFGSSTQPLLQVVPVITGYDVNGGTLTLTGAGFLEAASTYNLAGTIVSDTSSSGSPDVYWDDNTHVDISEPAHGLGPLTVTTTGGTSAPFALNEMTLPYGYLRDVAVDPTTGALWMSGDSPVTGRIRRIDPATSLEQQFFDLTNTDFGSTGFYAGGMQVTTEAFTLNATNVPAGSLLVFNGYAYPGDYVTAVNQATGAVIASLNLGANYDLTAGVYDPTTNHLFITDRRTSPTRIVEINPATGAVISTFDAPFNAGESGLAIDPVTGNLWYGSDQSNSITELTTAGATVRTVSLASQGLDNNEVNGLAFDAAGKLLVASRQGRIYRVTI